MSTLNTSISRTSGLSVLTSIWNILVTRCNGPLSSAVSRIRRRRVPVLFQLNATECAAACLAMVLGYHGRPTRIAEVRELTGVGRDGLNASTIMAAATHYGLRM